MRMLIILCLLLTALPPAHCQQADLLSGKVTLRAKGTSLSQLCDELTTQTGVKHKVTRELADQHLIVLAKDVTLGHVHKLISDLLKCKVSRDDATTGEAAYEFWRDAKGREEEAVLVRNAWTTIAGEIESQAENGQVEYQQDRPVIAPLLRILSEMDSHRLYDMVANKTLTLSYSEMPTTQQKALLETYGELEGSLQRKMNEDEDEGFVPVRRRSVSDEEIARSPLRLSVSTDIYSGRCSLIPRFTGKFSSWTMMICDLWLRDIAYLPVRGSPYAADEEKDEPDDALPKLEKPVDVPKEAKWEDLLEKLHEATGITMVSDHFIPCSGWHVQPNPMPAQIACTGTLDEQLDVLCKATDRLWWESEGDCLFRTQLWYLRPLFEVPRAQLETWQKKLVKSGRLDKADIDQMEKLTARRVEGLASLCGQWAMYSSDDFYEALQFYGSLNALQRSAVLSDGLLLRDLPPNQQDILPGLVASRLPAASDADIAGSRLVLVQGRGDPRHLIMSRASVKDGMPHNLSFWVDMGSRSQEIGRIAVPYPAEKKPVGTFNAPPKSEE